MKLASWLLELDGGAKQLPQRLQLNSRLYGLQLCGRILKGAVQRMLRGQPPHGGSPGAAEAIAHLRKCRVSSPRKPRGCDAEYDPEHPKSLLTVNFLL